MVDYSLESLFLLGKEQMIIRYSLDNSRGENEEGTAQKLSVLFSSGGGWVDDIQIGLSSASWALTLEKLGLPLSS